MIDLHTHSTASDGTDSPEDLVARAAHDGLTVLALTDHDTTEGLGRAAGALPAGLTLVPGAEMSCGIDVGPGNTSVSLHVLAYLFNPDEPRFAAARAELRHSRVQRARRMVGLMAADGHPISWERVAELADGPVGHPHIAAAMVEAAMVPNNSAAFTDRWIGPGGPYRVAKERPTVWEVLCLVAGAGGVAVLAHPLESGRGTIAIGLEHIERMAHAGLAGIEVDHPGHTQEQRSDLRAFANSHELIITGSSDYHGTRKPHRLGAETTSRTNYKALLDRAQGAEPIVRPIGRRRTPTPTAG